MQVAKILSVFLSVLTLDPSSANAVRMGNDQGDHIISEDLAMTKNEKLRAGFKYYLANLSETEEQAIPAEFRQYLLNFIETDEPNSAGGWGLTKSRSGYELQKWHIVSDDIRVGAYVTATESESEWRFSGLSFKTAHRRTHR